MRNNPSKQRREMVRLAIVFPIAGFAVLGFLVWWQDFPNPALWVVFAAAYVFFSWRAVEVNDRLYASPTVMVTMTAAVAFGPETAVLGCAAMAATGFLHPNDVRNRNWFPPAVNFGQLVLSTAFSTAVLTLFMLAANVEPGGWALDSSLTSLGLVALGSGLTAVVRGIVNLRLVRFIVHRVYGQRQIQPWSHMAQIHIPYVGLGFLGGLLGAAFVMLQPPDTSPLLNPVLPLIMIVFFVGHMAFESYGRLREAQLSTLRGFIKALEAKDLYTRGHTERVAHFAEMLGRELGFAGTRLQQLRWAALIHDVGKLAVPRDLIRKKARLTDDEYEQMQEHVHLVEDLLSEVEFLQPMVSIASNHHAHFDGNGYGHDDEVGLPLESRILAVADSFDAMTSTRSYRVAMSQRFALNELRRHGGTQFDPEIVETFVAALVASGEQYGLPDMNDEDEARLIAERAAVTGEAVRFPASQAGREISHAEQPTVEEVHHG